MEINHLLKEKSDLLKKYNKANNESLHYKEASVESSELLVKLLNTKTFTEMVPLLLDYIQQLYAPEYVLIFNDNKEQILIRNQIEHKGLKILLDTMDFTQLIAGNSMVEVSAEETVINRNKSMERDSEILKGVIQCNNIVYYYILIERQYRFSNYELDTLNNLLKMYSAIHLNKIMLEYLSKLVITSADAINYDPKTKAYSVRSLQNDYTRYEKKPHTYVFMDLDKFKSVNDTYGHDVGDIVLIKFAQHLTECADKIKGRAYRYGGEEFIIVAPGTIEEIYNTINQTRLEFSREVFNANGIKFNVTVSSGMYRGAVNEKAESCIKKADTLLYKAKESGRNRICY
ncbi:GGDEF domain-containing protein [Clostridium tertium]|uniref:GGDEF domain-containing protein n=1 Tax=Clostridium tertium TaxID=1559 RepID=UPI0023B30590|nr:GGDEF domain-containing protein [Clostridium tertium]